MEQCVAGLVADYGSDNHSDFTDSDEDHCQLPKKPHICNGDELLSNEAGLCAPLTTVAATNTVTLEPMFETNQRVNHCANATGGYSGKDITIITELSKDLSADNDAQHDDKSNCADEGQTFDRTKTQATLLPNPLSVREAKVEHSVFSSEYDHREQANRSVLEKHVKLTDDELEKNRNRPMCQGFLKGKCRYGTRCKFGHEKSEEGKTVSRQPDAGLRVFQHKPLVALQSGHRMDYEPEITDDDKYGSNQSRKRRYGIKDTLVPPKPSLRKLETQRRNDRPWTVNQ